MTPPRPATTTTPWSWIYTRPGVALLLILLYAGVSTARWVHRAARPAGSADEITIYENRFRLLRSALPARGVVGYVGHPDPTGPTPADSNAAALLHFRRYLLAQYSLAPVLLIEGTDHELIVGNFDPGSLPPVPSGFRLVRDFGDGVVLFRRAAT